MSSCVKSTCDCRINGQVIIQKIWTRTNRIRFHCPLDVPQIRAFTFPEQCFHPGKVMNIPGRIRCRLIWPCYQESWKDASNSVPTVCLNISPMKPVRSLFDLCISLLICCYCLDIALKGGKPRFEVPSIKNYFQDMDFILNVVSDGPNKSFAFRRLRYLESKFQLYQLLNEHHEVAESKVRTFLRPRYTCFVRD